MHRVLIYILPGIIDGITNTLRPIYFRLYTHHRLLMSAHTDVSNNDPERLLEAEVSDGFLIKIAIAKRLFREEFGEDNDSNKFLALSTRYRWEYFLLAYPLAAWAMTSVLEFFRQLEKEFLPLEEDENTGELVPESESSQDQLATPDQYFRREQAQGRRRLKAWRELLFGDFHSPAWRWNCPLTFLGGAKGSAEYRSKLRDELQKQMEGVETPWPKVIESAVAEISRRFDELERYLSDFKALDDVYMKEWRQSHPPGVFKLSLLRVPSRNVLNSWKST